MHLSTSLLLLPLAGGSLIPPTRTCLTPTSVQVAGFGAFTATPGPDGISSIFFTFSDFTSAVSTTCERELAPGSGPPDDSDTYYSCNDTAVHYRYANNILALKERFACIGKEEVASGNSTLAVDCIPEEPPFPLGYGLLCESPVEAFQIEVTVKELGKYHNCTA